jgi:hypothetical protein
MADGGLATAPRLGRPPSRVGTIDPHMPFEWDAAAQAFVEEHPDGADVEQIGCALGYSRENIRLIQRDALAALARGLARHGIGAADFAAMLAPRLARDNHDAWEHTSDYGACRTQGARDRHETARIGSGPQSPAALRLYSIVGRSRSRARRAHKLLDARWVPR